MRAVSVVVLTFMFVLATAEASRAANITLNPHPYTSTANSAAMDGSTYTATGLRPNTTPWVVNDSIVNGGSSSYTEFNVSNAGFNITFDHTRAATTGAEAGSNSDLYFTVDDDVDFQFSGAYAASDADGGTLRLEARLVDRTIVTALDWLYRSYQVSHSTPNESFILGLQGGDEANVLFGSPTGTLIAGHEYHFYFTTYINAANITPTEPATASGFVNLAFVPEPSTASLLALGLVGIAAVRRRGAA
jgi:hypothetical protein